MTSTSSNIAASVDRTHFKLVHEGLLEQRGAGTTAVASLGRESVERVAQERAQAAAELKARRQERSPNAPPDDDHDWISVPAAAELLGMTPNGVRWMCENERVPAVRRGMRLWLRRDLTQLVANAREVRTAYGSMSLQFSLCRLTQSLTSVAGWS